MSCSDTAAGSGRDVTADAAANAAADGLWHPARPANMETASMEAATARFEIDMGPSLSSIAICGR
jgi:hypothetical protein